MSISEKLLLYRQEITKNLNNRESLEYVYEKFKDEIKEYLENPLLLRPSINVVIEPLVESLKSLDGSENIFIYKLLAVICNVIGYKCFMSYLPHHISSLPRIISELNIVDDDDQFDSWEKYYVLLLWLAIICKNPFNFLLMDKKSDAQGDFSDASLTKSIVKICQKYLIIKTKSADAATYLTGQFFSRSEIMHKELPAFLIWSQEKFLNFDVQVTKSILLAITYIFKNGDRDDLLPFAQEFAKYLIDQNNLAQSPHVIIRKHYLKLIQHLIIINLDPCLAISRVECLRNKRSYKERVVENVVNNRPFPKTLPKNLENLACESPKELNGTNKTPIVNGPQPEQNSSSFIEEAIKLLVNGLCDKDSDIHYTAAKGISRISLHLPETYLDTMIDAILALFTPQTVGDTGWHGGCIGLAEMARKSLIPQASMELVMSCLWQALHFEKRSGTTYVGSRVRDAANYAYWSLVRTYEPIRLAPYVPRVSRELLNVALFDMDDKCRRAASATFQEFVGRLGEDMIPAGIEILTKVDFHAVSNLDRCYLELAPYVASLGGGIPGNYEYYRTTILNYLVDDRLGHCEPRVRNLAATCLGVIVSRCFNAATGDSQIEANEAFQKLVERLLSKNAINIGDARAGYFADHGTLKAIGMVVSGLRHRDLNVILGEDLVGQLKDLAKFCTSKTTAISCTNRQLIEGERWVWSAVCNLVSCFLTSLDLHNFSFYGMANGEDEKESISLVNALQNVIYPSVLADHGPSNYDIALSLSNNTECLLQYACQALNDVCHIVIKKHDIGPETILPKELKFYVKDFIVDPYLKPLLEYSATTLPQIDNSTYVNNDTRISCCYAISAIPAALLLATGNLNLNNTVDTIDDSNVVSLLLNIALADLGSFNIDMRKAVLDALIRISVSMIELKSHHTDAVIDINLVLGRVIKEGIVATGLYDYTRDSQRGDIGRTVRQSVLHGLHYMLSAVRDQKNLGLIIDWRLLIGTEVLIALVRQACSKLQPIRIQAGAVLALLLQLTEERADLELIGLKSIFLRLHRLLMSYMPYGKLCVKFAAILMNNTVLYHIMAFCALPFFSNRGGKEKRNDIDWSIAGVSYSTVIPLLKNKLYCHAVLSELLTSLGCLSDNTAKHSISALREYLLKANTEDVQLLDTTLNDIYRAHTLKDSSKSHVSMDHVTLLRATEAIINLNCIPFGENMTFYMQLLNNVTALLATKPRKTINKIFVALKIYGGLLLMTDDTIPQHSETTNGLIVFKRTVYGISDKYLIHKIPRVRKCAAEMLYEYFLVEGQELCPCPENLISVTAILSECDWLSMGDAKNKREELRILCGF